MRKDQEHRKTYDRRLPARTDIEDKSANQYKSTVPNTKGEVPERTHQQDRRSLEAYDEIRKEKKVTVSGYGTRRLYASKTKG